MQDEKPKPGKDEKGRFISGNIGGGRPKGARSKLSEAFLDALHDDFVEHGVEAIATVRMEKPDQYLKIIASILPKDLNVKTNDFSELSDEELDACIRSLDAELRPLLDGGGDPVH